AAYVLDVQLRLAPVGVPGEIYLGGAGLSLGYLNRPELTAERFIPHPFLASEKIYKTGDLGRWLPDGNIEYLGRADDQVKIRGYRIELGEIENVLQQSNLVAQAVVLAKTDEQGSKRLAGYVVPEGGFDKDGILSFLKKRLPEYMIPQIWVPLSRLPLNKNGKVDKKALPDADAGVLLTDNYIAPRNAMEQVLAGIWKELLRVQQVGIYDNFFELGGDSIITIQVVSRAKRAGYNLQPRDLFTCQNIAGLAAAMRKNKSVETSAEQGLLTGVSGLLPVQQWFFDIADASLSHFNQHVLLTIDKNISPEKLSVAVHKLLRYHDALRFSYRLPDPVQEYGTYEGLPEIIDLRNIAPDRLSEAVSLKSEERQRSLDIEQGILVRTVLMLTPDSEVANRLLIIVHHLAVDGVSWRILIEDLQLLLHSDDSRAAEETLGPKSSSLRQWYNALAAYPEDSRLLSQLDYWERAVSETGLLKTDNIYDYTINYGDTRSHTVKLNSLQTRQLLQEVPKAYHTEINDILLSALALTLAEWNQHNTVTIGLEGHGREDIVPGIDLSRTVGWFTSMFPVSLQVESGCGVGDIVKSVKEQLRLIPGKGIGYGVLRYIGKAASLQEQSWDVVFNYLGQMTNILTGNDVLGTANEDGGTPVGEKFAVPNKLYINSIIKGDELEFDWRYSCCHFSADSIDYLSAQYLIHLQAIIDHCASQTVTVCTPADFNLSGIVHYRELDAFLGVADGNTTRGVQVERIYPLSGLQAGMLFHGLYDATAGAYVEQMTATVGTLDEQLFVQSWQHLIKQHTVLRSAFYYDVFNIPVQCVFREVILPVQVLDYRAFDSAAQEAAIADYMVADRIAGFNFAVPPLMRISLFRLADDEYRLLWSFHHILLDGWSLPVLLEELLQTYELLVTGEQLPVTAEDRFEDYIRYINQRDSAQEAAYWQQYLAPLETGSLLPFIRQGSIHAKEAGNFKTTSIRLDTAVTADIITFAQQQRITLNTLMQGVWAYLLYRYTCRRDVVFGVTVSGRPEGMASMERAVGMYINTIPLYTRIGEQQEVTAWLRQLQAGQLDNREYQYSALNDVQHWSPVNGDLFDSILVFENYPMDEVLLSQPWKLQLRAPDVKEQTNYPLSITVVAGKTIDIRFEYNETILSAEDMAGIASHFETALLNIYRQATLTDDIEIFTEDEKHWLLSGINENSFVYPADKTLTDLFEDQVRQTPSLTAILHNNNCLTYQEVEERSNRLAQYLVSKGVERDMLIPLFIERSPEMIIAMLGVLKAGAAYVPVHPDYPSDRIAYILSDISATLVLSSVASAGLLQTDLPVIQ
ncbi:MAG TPA: condensation domain-containing protein, partial [Chitinophaga sp.]|uniref:condensation domain-containing protein n=1 Tax=Chitinophaga sp. TaxID=1869181 RepID=UPI002BE4915E